MKMLLVADFGGSFPENFRKHLLKQDFDLVLAAGDFADIKAIRELFFKYGDKSDEMFDKLPAKEKNRIRKRRLESVDFVLEKLNSLGKPVYLVTGNNDIWEYEKFMKAVSKYKNCINLDGSSVKINNFSIIGNGCEHTTEREEGKGLTDEDVYYKQEKILNNNFKKSKTKNMILLTHYPPYGCKLDKLPMTNPLNPGKHIGSHLIKDFIKRRCLPFVVCGHLEEYQGLCKIGQSVIINPGEGGAGKYAILNVNEKNFRKSEVIFYG